MILHRRVFEVDKAQGGIEIEVESGSGVKTENKIFLFFIKKHF